MTGACIVWRCNGAATDGTFCPRHAPVQDASAPDADAEADALAWLMVGEGLTLAEVSALT